MTAVQNVHIDRRRFNRLLLGSCSTLAFAQKTSRRRVAMLVGNGRYAKTGSLRNSVNDAQDMAAALQRCSFAATAKTDLTLSGFRQSIDEFVATLGAGDVALFFYAGHGIQIEGENYMIPVDFNFAQGEAKVNQGCVRISELQQRIEKSGARMNILVIDACRNNPFRPDSKVKGLALMDAGLGTCIALSACPGQVASDNPTERNGLFTKNLLQELSSPPTPIEQLFKKVKDRVYLASAQNQRPWLLFDTIGDFLFAQADVPPPPKMLELDTLVEKGRNEFQAGRFAEAVAAFENAYRIDQNNPYICNALGAARMRAGQSSVAVPLFTRAIQLKPDYAAAYYNRGLLYYTTSDQFRPAIDDFTWAIEAEPLDPRPYNLRGKAWLALSEFEMALADFDRALELNPADATALLGRGRIWFRQRKNADAIRDLTDSIAIRPAAETYAVRSQAFLAAGRRAESDADRARAERLQVR